MKRVFHDRAIIVLGVVLALLVIAEATIFPHYSPRFPWHYVPGYAAAIGLIGCIVVVLVSKWLGKTILQRPAVDDE